MYSGSSCLQQLGILCTLRVLEALAEQAVCLKRLITSTFRSSGLLHLLMGVLAPSLHRESTDSMIKHTSVQIFEYTDAKN